MGGRGGGILQMLSKPEIQPSFPGHVLLERDMGSPVKKGKTIPLKKNAIRAD